MNELEKQINLVVEARAMVEGEKLAYAGAYQKWLNENKTIIDVLEATKTVCAEREVTLREMAVKVFGETGNKQVAPGVVIRAMTRLNYEYKDAIIWALDHRLALKLDSSTFDKMVKANPLPFDFVKITEEPTATIATELQRVE